MRHQSKLLALSVLGALLVLAAIPLAARADETPLREFTAMYVFGDSLSDTGNRGIVEGRTAEAPYEALPDYPYDSGRFTNGKNWVDTLAKELFVFRGALPALKNPNFGNYAYAGARAFGGEQPDFAAQVDMYLKNRGGYASPHALYVVQFGGNDIYDALEAASYGADPITIIEGAVGAVLQNIQRLYWAGARRFLVANAPNLGVTPLVDALGAAGPAEMLSQVYNLGLDLVLSTLAGSELEIYRADFFSFTQAATDVPLGLGLGFSNATEPCLEVVYPDQDPDPGFGYEVCTDADQRLFWDGLHPTTAAHRIIGNIAVNALGLNN